MKQAAFGMMCAGLMTWVVVTAPSALATPPPAHEFVSDPAWFQEFVAWDAVDCGTFTIHETAVKGRWNKTTFFDDAGEPVLVQEHYTFDGVMENLSTGETITDRFATNFKFQIIKVGDDYDYDVYTAAGTTFHFTQPGQGLTGPTLVGRYVYSRYSDLVIFSAGPHPQDIYAFEQSDPVAFCPMLA